MIVLFFLVGVFGGFLGSLVGLGGGIVIVPFMVIFGVDVKVAVTTSIFATIGTWASASEKYLKSGLVDFRIALLLGSATSIGALMGSRLLFMFPEKLISVVFIGMAAIIIINNFKNPRLDNKKPDIKIPNLIISFLFMVVAGFVSAILGIGAGVFKVFVMDRIIKLPYRVSTATSMFLIGITASSSAIYYSLYAPLNPRTVAVVALGAVLGGFMGSRIMLKLPVLMLRIIFSVVVIVLMVSLSVKVFT